nr:N-acetyltransferase [Peterkaempfera griseoplana]
MGSAPACAALDDARSRGLPVVVGCPFTAARMDRRPEGAGPAPGHGSPTAD